MFKNWNLQDWANLAQILGLLALPLSVALWYFTRAHFETFWRKWRKAVFVALAILAIVGGAYRGWFDWIGDFLRLFSHRVELPLWLLGLLVLACFLCVAAIGKLRGWRKKADPTTGALLPEPNHTPDHTALDPRKWTQGIIFGALWSWRYVYGQIDVRSLVAFCPHPSCKNRLDIRDDFDRMSNPNIYYHTIPAKLVCSRCGFSVPMECARIEVNACVGREAERLINTGQFVEKLNT